MKSALRVIHVHMALLALLSAPAVALEPSSITGDDWMDLSLEIMVRQGDNVERLHTKARLVYMAFDFDGGGISPSDFLIQREMDTAAARGQRITEWLQQDLNGDGRVTRGELERYFSRKARTPDSSNAPNLMAPPERVAQDLKILIGNALKGDRNSDDVVDFDEARDWAQSIANRRVASRWLPSNFTPMLLDNNTDGTVSFEEFDAAVGAAFARIDNDANGEFSAEEIAAYKQNNAKRRRVLKAEERVHRRATENRR